MKYIVILIITLLSPNISNSEEIEYDTMCGPKSLLGICSYYRIDSTIDELCKMMDYNPSIGVNMLAIYNTAKAKGLNVVPLKVEYKELLIREGFYIVYLDNNHFEILLKKNETEVLLQNYPAMPYYQDVETYLCRWKGQLLEFSRSNSLQIISSYDGARMKISPQEYNFATVSQGEYGNTYFIIENIGSDDLKIQYARSSCSCVKTLLLEKNILSANESILFVEYSTTNKTSGEEGHYIVLKTNDNIQPTYKIPLKINITGAIEVIPSSLFLDEEAVNTVITKDIVIRNTSIDNIDINNVVMPKYINISYNQKDDDRNSIHLSVNIETGPYPQKVNDTISIKTKDGGDIVINVRGNIVSDIKSNVNNIIFDNSSFNNEIIISSDNSYTIDKINTIYDNYDICISAIDDSLKYKVSIELNSINTDGILSDSLFVFTNNHEKPQLIIPIITINN